MLVLSQENMGGRFTHSGSFSMLRSFWKLSRLSDPQTPQQRDSAAPRMGRWMSPRMKKYSPSMEQ